MDYFSSITTSKNDSDNETFDEPNDWGIIN